MGSLRRRRGATRTTGGGGRCPRHLCLAVKRAMWAISATRRAQTRSSRLLRCRPSRPYRRRQTSSTKLSSRAPRADGLLTRPAPPRGRHGRAHAAREQQHRPRRRERARPPREKAARAGRHAQTGPCAASMSLIWARWRSRGRRAGRRRC
jgi:hypothetical protein